MRALAVVIVALAVVAGVTADRSTNTRDDRTAQALNAVQAAIGRAVSDGSTSAARQATLKGMNAAMMTTRESAVPSDIDGGRKLLGSATNPGIDRFSRELIATQESSARIISASAMAETAMAPSRSGLAFAKLATRESAHASDFGVKRKLQDSGYNLNSDRITQSMNAAHDVVDRSASGLIGAREAAGKNMAYSKLATKLSAKGWEFGDRKLLVARETN